MASQTGVFTTGFSGKGAAANFTSDDDRFAVGINASGEAYLDKTITVTFDTDGGSAVEAQQIVSSSIPTRPEAPTKEGYVFKGWLRNDNVYDFDTPLTGDTTLTAKWITVWQDLQDQINAAEEGKATTITLTQNVKALSTETALTVPEGKKITLDLGSYTLDRGLPQGTDKAKQNGSVIIVLGQLTVTGNGTITGGNSARGGGVCVEHGGKFTLSGGTITGNTSNPYGGGVYVRAQGSLALTGGAITGNTAAQCGGVYCARGSTFELSGDPVVQDNKATNVSDASVSNVGFSDEENGRITVTGKLASTASIGVDKIPGVFTTGLKGNGTNANFTSDYDGFMVLLTADGEARLNTLWVWLQEQINAAKNSATITLTRDITALNSERTQVVPEGKDITLDLNGHVLEYNTTGPVIELKAGSRLTVKDSAPNAAHGDEFSYPAKTGTASVSGGIINLGTCGILVKDGSKLTLAGGTVFGNGHVSKEVSGPGRGGVVVEKGGAFTMTGGTVAYNATDETLDGGGVCNAGTFTMSGGVICANNSRNGGGVYNEGTFTLSGGVIKNNGAYIGGGVYVAKGAFTMKAGEISGNNAVNDDNENTREGFGAGVYVYSLGEFNMSGGRITGNTASTHGGGVFVGDGTYNDNENSARFTMTAGEISGNTAQYCGGGVTNESLSVFNLSGGEIRGNTAKDGSGVDNYSTFTMSGGRITGNKVTGDNKPIGGVRNGTTNRFTMTGGEISGNEGYGLGGPYEFTLSGKIEIRNNKLGNVILGIRSKPKSDFVQVAGKLENQTPIGIFMDVEGDFDAKVFTSGLFGNGSDENFASEQEGYEVVLLTTGEAMLARPVKITFDKNAASATGNMPAQNMAPGFESALKANAFTRRGYSFAGWNTKADGKGKAYADKAALTPDGAMTLYAQWTAHEITVAAVAARTYTGRALTPAPAVKDKTTGKALKSGMDYTVTYKNNVNAGTATVTIIGKGDYADARAVSVTFEINKAELTVTAPTAKTLTCNGKAQALVNAGKATGGTMQYSLDNKNWSETVPHWHGRGRLHRVLQGAG